MQKVLLSVSDYRNKDKDVLLADLVGQVLTNGKAGLLDLNLVKKQKLLRASAFTYPLIDYGFFIFLLHLRTDKL